MFSECSTVPCQHRFVRRAGESITHMQQWRHHMTVHGLKLSSLFRNVNYVCEMYPSCSFLNQPELKFNFVH